MSKITCGVDSLHKCLSWSRRRKMKKQRADRGYCEADLWCMADYLLMLLPQMLRRFIETSHGYPGWIDGKAITKDEYEQMVISVADRFEKVQEMIDGADDAPINSIVGYNDMIQHQLDDAFHELSHVFFSLWGLIE